MAHIEERGALNTSTPFMMTLAAPITYKDPNTDDRTDICVRTVALSPNLLPATPSPRLLGDSVAGIANSTNGGRPACQLESWRPCSDMGWIQGGTSPVPGGSERDLDSWAWASLSVTGGSVYGVSV